MMKPLTIIAFTLMFSQALSQIPAELTWTKEYTGTTYTATNKFFPIEAQACAFDTSGRLYVAGRIYNYRPSNGTWSESLKIIKYNSIGKEIASQDISGTTLGVKNQTVNKVVNDNKTNSVYTLSTYYYNNSRKNDIHLAKYTPSLTLVWEKFIAGIDTSNEAAVDMEIDTAGNVFITGNLENDGTASTSGQNITVHKYSKSGALVWSYNYTGGGKNTDKVNALKIDKNQDVICAGSTYNASKGNQILVFKLDKNTGSLLWDFKYNGDNTIAGNDEAYDLDVDNNKNVYVVGAIELAGSVKKGMFLKVSAAGVGGFKKQLGFLLKPTCVIFKNNYLWLGGNNLTSGYQKIKLAKYTLTGTQTFVNTYSATTGSNNYFDDMMVSISNNVYITGRANNSYYFFNTDKNGTLLWQHFDTPLSPSNTHSGTCLGIDETHGVAAGCGFKHYKTGDGEWTSNYYSPAQLKLTTTLDNNLNDNNLFNIYPNPASDYINIKCRELNATIEITDIAGRMVWSDTLNEEITNIKIENLNPGIYTIKFIDGNKFEYKKFIKQ